MKKAIVLMLCIVMAVAAIGCGNSRGEQKEVEGDLTELVQKIYDTSGLEMPITGKQELTDENAAYYLGTDQVPFTEGIGSEPMISSVPHSLVLIRVAQDADIEAIKTLIQDSADPWKWICVGVEDDDVIVDNIGHLIVLIMDANAEELHTAFLALAE